MDIPFTYNRIEFDDCKLYECIGNGNGKYVYAYITMVDPKDYMKHFWGVGFPVNSSHSAYNYVRKYKEEEIHNVLVSLENADNQKTVFRYISKEFVMNIITDATNNKKVNSSFY